MGACPGEAAERTPARVVHEITSITPGRQLAEDHGRHDIAAFLRQATDLGLDELNALNNT